MTFDDATLLWALGGMGLTLMYHAIFGTLPNHVERKTFIGYLLVMGLWTVGVAVAAVLAT